MKRIPGKVPPFSIDYNGCPVALRFYPRKEITMSQPPTVFEILAKQYRDWCTETFGAEHGAPVAEDALETAKVATVSHEFGPLAIGDHLLVWDRGSVAGPVGSKRVARLCGWVPSHPAELLHDVQNFAHVIWERS